MATITGLKLNKNRKRVSIFADGVPKLTVSRDVILKAGLRKDQELTKNQFLELQEADSWQQCFDAALDFLSYRPRSESEVKQRLHKRGFNPEVINNVVTKLYENNLINDKVFALYWKNNREDFNPRSRSVVKHELLLKGVTREIADEIVSEMDEEQNAYSAAVKKARVLRDKTYEEFRNRLYNYLKWRGFKFDIIARVTERLWQEPEASSR